MTIFTDYAGRAVRFTDERREHVLLHPEMVQLEPRIEQAVAAPDVVVRSRVDDTVFLYHRLEVTGGVGTKYLCVVIKHLPADSFVITAHLTDKIKRGEIVWEKP